jgi:hypothetical protein
VVAYINHELMMLITSILSIPTWSINSLVDQSSIDQRHYRSTNDRLHGLIDRCRSHRPADRWLSLSFSKSPKLFMVSLYRGQTAVQTDPPLYHTAVQVAWTIYTVLRRPCTVSVQTHRGLHCTEVVLLTTLITEVLCSQCLKQDCCCCWRL